MVRNFCNIIAALLALCVTQSTLAQENSSTSAGICQPGAGRAKEELDAYRISDLHYVGILNHQGKVWAILATPDKKVYRATVGNYLGKEAGCVKAILNKKLVIEGATNKSGKARRWELPIEE